MTAVTESANAEIENKGTDWLRWILNTLTAALIVTICVVFRHWYNPDFISYMDVGEAWLRGEVHNAVNGYWFPIYPILVAGAAKLFPSREWEAVAGHLVNLLLHLASLLVFNWLLQQIDEFIRGKGDRRGRRIGREVVLIGFAIFVWCDVVLTNPMEMTPDSIVAMSLMAAAGIFFRVLSRGWNLRRFVALGIVLGFGYLTKAIMLSVGLVFIGAFVFAPGFSWKRILNLATAALFFALINIPHIILLSKKMGRLDLGDTGRLAYAWYVNDVDPFFPWTGEPPEAGAPKHPPRKLLDQPPVFDFSAFPFGTFPAYADPAYTYDGLKTHFDLRKQTQTLAVNLKPFVKIFLDPAFLALFVGFALLLAKALKSDLPSSLRQTAPLLLPALAGLAAYLLVLVSRRYVAYFTFLILIALAAALLKSARAGRSPLSAVFALCLLSIAAATWDVGKQCYRGIFGNSRHLYTEHLEVARALKDRGLKPGDWIGVFGTPFEASYARIAGVRIMVEGCAFAGSNQWLNDSDQRQRALGAAAKLPLKAVVLEAAPANLETNVWSRVGQTSFAIHFADQ